MILRSYNTLDDKVQYDYSYMVDGTGVDWHSQLEAGGCGSGSTAHEPGTRLKLLYSPVSREPLPISSDG